MKNLILLLLLGTSFCFLNSCEKTDIKTTKQTTITTKSHITLECRRRTSVTYEELAGSSGNYEGELNRLLDKCVVQAKACEAGNEVEYDNTFFFINDVNSFDANNNQIFEIIEQDAIINAILDKEANYTPSCSPSKFLSIRVFLSQDNLACIIKYICCGHYNTSG